MILLKLNLPFPLNLSCRDAFLLILFLFLSGKTFKFRIRQRKTRDHESGTYNQLMSVIMHQHVFCILYLCVFWFVFHYITPVKFIKTKLIPEDVSRGFNYCPVLVENRCVADHVIWTNKSP